jgi:VIT1/CCC1 family predicted Fe2+/Mn2+ transporter
LNQVGARGRGALSLRRLSQTTDAGEAHELIADALPPVVASALRPEDLETIRGRLAALPDPWKGPPLTRDDFLGAVGVFLLVFLSTFPVVIPFFLIHETVPALRVSNAVAIALLLYGGYKLGKYAGFRPWLTALALAALGILLVAITIALGG